MKTPFPYKWIVASVFVCGLFMDLMDTTIVNVALPTLGRTFGASNTTLEWIITGYLLSLAVWIPASGWLGDRIGTKRVFLFALATFSAASALCGLAANVDQLIAFRILQGIGGGMLTPVGSAMLFRAFPPSERARASAVLLVPTMVAPALGPLIGGALVDHVTWRAIFWINLPIGFLGLVFAALFLQEHREDSAGAFDFPGFALSGAGLALVLFALSRAPEFGWTSTTVLATAIAGIAAFVILVPVELTRTAPMLDLRLFADRMFRNGNLAFYAGVGNLFAGVLLLTLMLQQLRGLSAFNAGLVQLPSPLGIILVIPVVARLYPVVGPRRLIAAGMVLGVLSSLAFATVDLSTSLWEIAGIAFVRGLAFGACLMPIQTATFATVTPRSMGRATSIYSTGRQVAASLSVAVLITVLTTRTQFHLGHLAASGSSVAFAGHAAILGFHDAFLTSAIIGIVGLAFSLLIHDRDAAATMRHPVAAPATVLKEPAVELVA